MYMENYVDLAEGNDYGVETIWLDGIIIKQKYISNEIKNAYVSFETAKLLKYKGADFDTDKVYTSMGRAWEINMKRFKEQFDYDVSNYIQRPTLQMAMRWLRETKNIDINVDCSIDKDIHIYTNTIIDPDGFVVIDGSTDYYITYEKACESAIKYCLENLVK